MIPTLNFINIENPCPKRATGNNKRGWILKVYARKTAKAPFVPSKNIAMKKARFPHVLPKFDAPIFPLPFSLIS